MRETITETCKLIKNHNIPFVTLDGEVGMMNVEKGQYFSTNLVGTRVWELMEQQTSIHEIVQVLMKEYEVDINTCRAHVTEFINELYKGDLIIVNQIG